VDDQQGAAGDECSDSSKRQPGDARYALKSYRFGPGARQDVRKLPGRLLLHVEPLGIKALLLGALSAGFQVVIKE
jgi:hypothetical protein